MTIAEIDTAIFRAINGLSLAPLDSCWVLLSQPEFGFATATLLALYFSWRKQTEAVWIILAGGIAIALCDSVGAQVLKPLIGRVRPCFALPPEAFRLLVPMGATGSMPSLHAANSVTVALVAFVAERRTGWVLFPLAGLIALSRVGVGVHWPSDLLGGFLWGGICGGGGWGLVVLGRAAWGRWRRGSGSGDAGPEGVP